MCFLGAQIDKCSYLTTDAHLIKAIYHLCCFYYLTPLCLHLYSLTQKQNPRATRLVWGDNLLSSVTSSAPMSAGLSGTRAKNTVCCSNINPFDIHLLVWRQKNKTIILHPSPSWIFIAPVEVCSKCLASTQLCIIFQNMWWRSNEPPGLGLSRTETSLKRRPRYGYQWTLVQSDWSVNVHQAR